MPKITEQHREARRAQILDAARRCFVREGFHETSMQELLAEAGLSSGAVYGYFSSKDELIVAIAEDNISQISALLRSFTDRKAPGTARDLLIEVLGFIRSKHAENGFAAIALLVWSEATRNAELAARLTELIEGVPQLLRPACRTSGPAVERVVAPDGGHLAHVDRRRIHRASSDRGR